MKRKEFAAEEYRKPGREAVATIDKELALMRVYASVPEEAIELLPELDLGRDFLEYASGLRGKVAPIVTTKTYTISGGRGDGMTGVSPTRRTTREIVEPETGLEVLLPEMRERVRTLKEKGEGMPKTYKEMTADGMAYAADVRTLALEYLSRVDEVDEFATRPIY